MTGAEKNQLDDARRVERLFDPVYFDALLAFTEEVCLEKPGQAEPSIYPAGDEHAVIEKVGIAGLRAALDYHLGDECIYGTDPDVEDDGFVFDTMNASPDSPIRYPEAFSDGFNYEQSARVEAFGKQLMHESWKTLGPDAQKMIELFKNASTDKEQIKVLRWLDRRLMSMVHDQSVRHEDEIYHPIRLSPKAIGTYPRHDVAPTCLGVSVIAAGLLREAGADFLHAGVVTTGRQQLLLDIAQPSLSRIRQAKVIKQDMPDQLLDRLENRASDILAKYAGAEYGGAHAALFVRLQSGGWWQFDSNLGLTVAVPEVNDDDAFCRRLDDAYDHLSDLHGIAPGVEAFVPLEIPTMARRMNEIRARVRFDTPGQREAIRSILLDEDAESVLERLKRVVLQPFFEEIPVDSSYKESSLEFMRTTTVTYPNDYTELLLESAYYDAAESWLTDQEDLLDVLERCRKDEHYLGRKLDDALLLGRLTAETYASRLCNPAEGHIEPTDLTAVGRLHTAIEVGLPESRIGNAVLGDFATFCGNDLSMHHWQSQWPSIVPMAERISLSERSDAEQHHLRNALSVAAFKRCTYAPFYFRINKFLYHTGVDDVESEE